MIKFKITEALGNSSQLIRVYVKQNGITVPKIGRYNPGEWHIVDEKDEESVLKGLQTVSKSTIQYTKEREDLLIADGYQKGVDDNTGYKIKKCQNCGKTNLVFNPVVIKTE